MVMIMDYEKAYKEALERARKYKLKEDLLITQDIFPELAESEDEKIRRRLLEYFKSFTMTTVDIEWENLPVINIIAWLEKQGEQKPVEINIDKMVLDYANTKERGDDYLGKPIKCQIRAYRQGIEDTLNIGLKLEKPVKWSEEDKNWIDDLIKGNYVIFF